MTIELLIGIVGFLALMRKNGNSGSAPAPVSPDPTTKTSWTRGECSTWGGQFNPTPTAGQLYCSENFPDLYPQGFKDADGQPVTPPTTEPRYQTQPVGDPVPLEEPAWWHSPDTPRTGRQPIVV